MVPLPPTTAIGPQPSGPVRPGSLPMKIPTSGTPSAAATWSNPVSTPTTTEAPAISAATSSSGLRSGTSPHPNAATTSSLRRRSAADPQGSITLKPRSTSARASVSQCDGGHSLSMRAVPWISTA